MHKIRLEIKWAFIFLLASLVWIFIERISGLHSTYIHLHYIYTNVFVLIALSVYSLALGEIKKKKYDGSISFKEVIISGLLMTAVITFFAPVNQLLIAYLVSPNYFQNIINYTVSSGNMTQIEAESYFSLSSYIVQVLIGSPILGTLTTVLVGFFIKNK